VGGRAAPDSCDGSYSFTAAQEVVPRQCRTQVEVDDECSSGSNVVATGNVALDDEGGDVYIPQRDILSWGVVVIRLRRWGGGAGS
jgi:hypothetical protein